MGSFYETEVWAGLGSLAFIYSLIQKNGDTFAIVYSNKCVTVFLNQTLYVL